MNWIDGHCHLADKRFDSKLSEVIVAAQGLGISQFVMAGVDPDDWQRQRLIARSYPGLYPCFGLHPYWVASHNEEDCEIALDVLAKELGDSIGLGELGLDYRSQFVSAAFSRERQMDMFVNQLQMAIQCQKPIVLHIVRAHDEAIRALAVYGLPKAGGMVHSFNGSASQAKSYLELGLKLSVGGPACREDNQRLHQAIRETPNDKLIIETDSPDQAPPGWEKVLNQPSSLILVAEAVGRIKGLSLEAVLDQSALNLRQLFSL